jgi:hypothetical protein
MGQINPIHHSPRFRPAEMRWPLTHGRRETQSAKKSRKSEKGVRIVGSGITNHKGVLLLRMVLNFRRLWALLFFVPQN